MSLDGRFRLEATLPPSEPIDGTVLSARLLGADRPVGVAYARAIMRTIDTYLTGDYRRDEAVVAALADATGLECATLRDLPPVLFDWELREGTASRIEDQFRMLGSVTYDVPLDASDLVDRTVAGGRRCRFRPRRGPR